VEDLVTVIMCTTILLALTGLVFARSRCNLGARDFSEHNHQVSQARCAIEMRTGKRGEKRLQPGRHYCRVAF